MWQDARVRPLVVLLLASACGARPPAPIENADQPVGDLRRAGDAYERTAWKRRPQIDVSWLLPDFHDELRWPLSGMHHPKLEPEFPVAQELAIGVDWQGLCARGVHRRISATQKELISYLRGWCHVQERDVDGACAELVPLLGSVKSGLRDAVRRDLANILVESGDAEKAEHWLTKHHVRDIETLDLLAANYVEVGSPADAFAINRRVIDEDDYATPATKCRRLVRRIAIGFDIDVELPVRELERPAPLQWIAPHARSTSMSSLLYPAASRTSRVSCPHSGAGRLGRAFDSALLIGKPGIRTLPSWG